MKKLLIVAALSALLFASCGPNLDPVARPETFTNEAYFDEKNGLYNELPVNDSSIVMFGDDYIDRGAWDEFFGSKNFKNRGITYDNVANVLYRTDSIAKYHPAKVFISVGFQDVADGKDKDYIVSGIRDIMARFKAYGKKTELYYISIIPRGYFNEEQIELCQKVNSSIRWCSGKDGFTFVDLSSMCADKGYIGFAYSFNAGKHLNGAGYEAFTKILAGYVNMAPLNKADDKDEYPEISEYYVHRVSMFRSLPTNRRAFVMLGNSLNNNAPWSEIFPDWNIINRGISGDVVGGIMYRLDDIARNNPYKIILMTGTNDLINDKELTVTEFWKRYEFLIKSICEIMPYSQLVVQSMLPLNPKTEHYEGFNEKVVEINKLLNAAASKYGYLYIDVASELSDENGDLAEENTTDGIHLSATGYFKWATRLINSGVLLNLDKYNLLPLNNVQE